MSVDGSVVEIDESDDPSSPNKSVMPPAFVEALKNPLAADPEVLEEALAWQEVQSPSKLLEQAKVNKEKKAKGIRLDIMTQPVPASYWKDIPRVFPTPFGPLSIAEMRAQPELAEALEAIMVDHDTIVDRVENPDWIKQNKVWVSQQGISTRQEAPLCVLTRRLYSQNPTAKGCNNFVAGALNTGIHANTGVVRLNCKSAGCPGNVARDWDMLSLHAWFAHKSKQQLEKSGEVDDFIRFLFSYACTLDALAFAEEAHEQWCARQKHDATAALDKSAQAALAAATGKTSKTPGSARSARSKSSEQVQGQQKLGKYLTATPGGSQGKQTKKGDAGKKRKLSFSSKTPDGKGPKPATTPASVVSDVGKKKKHPTAPAASKAKGAALDAQEAGESGDDSDRARTNKLKRLKAQLRKLQSSKSKKK